jgi:hypothetical protein
MQILNLSHIEAFKFKLVELELFYTNIGREDFDVAYSANVNASTDGLFCDEEGFKKDLNNLKSLSLEKSKLCLIHINALKESISEAKRQIELEHNVNIALNLIK